jgi:protein subunit release factor A
MLTPQITGWLDRSDKIRRIIIRRTGNGSSNQSYAYNLDRIVLGDLDPVIDALKLAENTERLKEMVSEEVNN